ncbi:hypothetical protein CYMTET_37060 [Cymbomonas tetramitiformis]|uniref:RING-type domain-containing protein n=1 Tax=Cymbomonas tetramitiformis TaxID=36881 RepID=A0AAE0CGZ3_9CHLO|nr:hypothetical protein CYMTET_37060 [Cymbomonas tetramitiformis]
MLPVAQQTSEQFARRIDTGLMCVMQLNPGTVFYISERKRKCGEFVFVESSTFGWYDMYLREQGLVTRKLLDNLSDEETSQLVSVMRQKRSTEKRLRALMTNSYEIRIPSDGAGENAVLCTVTFLHGSGVVYGGRNIGFADKPFARSAHGINLEEFCMNVTYFSCVFGIADSISWLCEIVDNSGLEGGFAWMRHVGNVTAHFHRGYNFLHHVGLAFWEPKLIPVVLGLFPRALPEALRGDQGQVVRLYKKWLVATTADGQTPLSAAVLGANEAAVAEFLKFAPSLHPVVERGVVADRYWNPKFSKGTTVNSMRPREKAAETVQRIRLLLKEATRTAIDKSEQAAKELLSQETASSRTRQKSAKKKAAKGKPGAPPVELERNAPPDGRKSLAVSLPRAVSREPSLGSSSTATFARDVAGSPAGPCIEPPPESPDNAEGSSLRALAHAPPADDGLVTPSGRRLCIICCDQPFSVALVPCGHVCLCRGCSTRGRLDRCPMCRAKIDSLLNLYCG